MAAPRHRLARALFRPLLTGVTGPTAAGGTGAGACAAGLLLFPAGGRAAAAAAVATTPRFAAAAPLAAIPARSMHQTPPSFAATPVALADDSGDEAAGKAPPPPPPATAPSIPDAVAAAAAAATAPGVTCHPILDAATTIAQPAYSRAYLESIVPTHLPPATTRQKVAYRFIQTVRSVFDRVTGYRPDAPNSEAVWVRRFIFLETVAGVPGMVAGAVRHLQSLRLMRYDGGWISDLLAESENERMHLVTFMELRKPGPLFRAAVFAAQGVFWNLFFFSYLASPKTAHAVVGYLEEEAVKTYTHALEEIDAGRLWPAEAGVAVPKVARAYWGLPKSATMRDLILAVRADEYGHARANHTFSIIPADAPNPFVLSRHQEGQVDARK